MDTPTQADPINNIPFHRHTGTDSPQIESSDILGGSTVLATRGYRASSDMALNAGALPDNHINAVSFDDLGAWDSGNNRFNILSDGVYDISANVLFNVMGTGQYALAIYTSAGQHSNAILDSTNGNMKSLSVQSVIKLTAGDHIKFRCYNGSATNSYIYAGSASTWCSIIKL